LNPNMLLNPSDHFLSDECIFHSGRCQFFSKQKKSYQKFTAI
jgi:hypothetical protein